MGRQFARGASFLGVPMVKARNVLRAWRHGESDNASEICNRSDVGLDAQVVAMLLQEFEERGLIGTEVLDTGREIHGLTEAGVAFATASGKGRTPRGKAGAVLDALLDRCAAVNADPESPHLVDQVWLFGSMVRDAPDVGDIDFVVTRRWSPAYEAIEDLSERGLKARNHALGRLPSGALRDSLSYIAAAGILFDRRVLGSPRNPLLAITDLSELLKLACPCRLVFDIERGGRFDGPVLERHPDAGERHPDARPPPAMPDLSPRSGPIRPVSVGYAWEVEVNRVKNQGLGLFPPEDGAFMRLVQARQRACGHLVADIAEMGAAYRAGPATDALRDAGVLDGRSVAGLLSPRPRTYEPSDAEVSFLVERTIEEGGDTVGYGLSVREARAADLPMHEHAGTLLPVLLVAAADIVRIARLDDEAGRERVVAARFVTEGGAGTEHGALLRMVLEAPAAWLGKDSADVAGRLRLTVNGREVWSFEEAGADRDALPGP